MASDKHSLINKLMLFLHNPSSLPSSSPQRPPYHPLKKSIASKRINKINKMRTSSLLWLTAAFLLNFANPTLANAPQPTDRTSPPVPPSPKPLALTNPPPACATPKSYPVLHNLPQSVYVEKTATVSEGYLCCRLCHDSELDCAAAAFDELADSKNCRMAINTRELVGARTEEMCPLGVSMVGDEGAGVEDWSEWILGPCLQVGR